MWLVKIMVNESDNTSDNSKMQHLLHFLEYQPPPFPRGKILGGLMSLQKGMAALRSIEDSNRDIDCDTRHGQCENCPVCYDNKPSKPGEPSHLQSRIFGE